MKSPRKRGDGGHSVSEVVWKRGLVEGLDGGRDLSVRVTIETGPTPEGELGPGVRVEGGCPRDVTPV